MKRIYIFGRIVKTAFILSSLFLIYAFIDLYIKSSFKFINLLLLIIIVGFVIFCLVWIYSMGVFIDKKNNKVKIVTGFLKEEKLVRPLSDINTFDIELKDNIGMNFIINYKYGYSEKIFYHFYRISIVEKSQYKRLKKQLSKIEVNPECWLFVGNYTGR